MRAFVVHPDIKSQRNRRLPEHGLAEAVSLAAALPAIDVIGAARIAGNGAIDQSRAIHSKLLGAH